VDGTRVLCATGTGLNVNMPAGDDIAKLLGVAAEDVRVAAERVAVAANHGDVAADAGGARPPGCTTLDENLPALGRAGGRAARVHCSARLDGHIRAVKPRVPVAHVDVAGDPGVLPGGVPGADRNLSGVGVVHVSRHQGHVT